MKHQFRELRSSNFELLRVFAMIAIVAHHCSVLGAANLLGSNHSAVGFSSFPLANKVFAALLMPGGGVGVGLFFMLTGFFLTSKNLVSAKRTCLTVLFYAWALIACSIIVSCITGQWNINLLHSHLQTPITGNVWWFATSYVVLLLLLPHVNPLIRDLNAWGFICALCFIFLFWMWHSAFFFGHLATALFWYLCGALAKNHFPDSSKRPSWYLFSACIFWVGCSACQYLAFLGMTSFSDFKGYPPLLLTVPTAICFFQFFRTIRIRNSLRINRLAATTFGIYLIHNNPFVRNILWNDILHVSDTQVINSLFPLWESLDILVVFIGCAALDGLRQKYAQDRFDRLILKIIAFCDTRMRSRHDKPERMTKSDSEIILATAPISAR